MAGNRDWVISAFTLVLPPGAGPLDDQILMGTTLPGCLASRYAAAIIFRQNSPVFRGQFYLGVVRNDIGVLPDSVTTWIERGFMLNDPTDDSGTGTCWIYATGRWVSSMGPGATYQKEFAGNLVIINGPAVDQTFESNINGFFSVDGSTFLRGGLFWGSPNSISGDNTVTGSFTSTSTTYTTSGGTVCGVAFTAPPSGRMLINFGGRMSNSGAGTPSVWIALSVNTGGSIGSGSVVTGPTDDIAVDRAGGPIGSWRIGAAYLVTGLSGGSSYNAFLQHRVESGTGTFSRRFVVVTPAL